MNTILWGSELMEEAENGGKGQLKKEGVKQGRARV